jgi:PAS domain-containing protein
LASASITFGTQAAT